MDDIRRGNAEARHDEPTEKLPYEAPELISHGTVEDLVAAIAGGPIDGLSGSTAA